MEWLSGIIGARQPDLFLLREFEAIKPVLLHCKIELKNGRPGRKIPIRQPQGYLIFEKSTSEEVAQQLLSFFDEAIQTQQTTPAGILNFLLLVDRIDSFVNSDTYDLSRNVCARIPEELYQAVIDQGVKLYNKEYHLDSSKKPKVLSVKEWLDLFLRFEYLEPFDNPIDVMRILISSSPPNVKVLDVLSEMKPDPRTAVVNHGFSWSAISEKDLVRYVKKNPDDLRFFAAVVLDQSEGRPENSLVTLIGTDAAKALVTTDWLRTGRFLFRSAYAGARKKMNSEISKRIEEALDEFLLDELKHNTRSAESLIKTFDWPQDFIAFGGWIARERSGDSDFGSAWVSDLSDAVVELFRSTISDIRQYVSDSKNRYSMWPQDPFELKTTMLFTYLNWSILIESEEQWKRVSKEFKNLCYELKNHYYASRRGSGLALQISNSILGILLSYPKVDRVEGLQLDRMSVLLGSFADIIGLQWVRAMERDSMVWDFSARQPSFGDMDVLYIIKRLSDVPEMYVPFVSEFKNQIRLSATITWPFDLQDESDA